MIKILKIKSGGLIMLLILLTLSMATLAAEDDPLITAVQDEMKRGMEGLRLEDENPPYFMDYLINLEHNCTIRAEYGSAITCECNQGNQMFLDLRVGGYDFDNGNVFTNFFGAGLNTVNLPDETDYNLIRKISWLQMDGDYKDALETLANKRAMLQSVIPDDTIADLSTAEKVINVEEISYPDIDTAAWKDLLEKMSRVFSDYPQFKRSSVQLNTKMETRYVINSEGTVIRRPRQIHYLMIDASALDKNGLPVYLYDRKVVDNIADFPDRKSLLAWAGEFAEEAAQTVEAETIDTYIGPVIFTPGAAAQIFSQLFIENISDPRKPLTPDGRLDSYLHNARLTRKVGFRVLPDFLSVTDDPTISEYNDIPLFGHYLYDDQGVPAQKINLVENGKLKNYYMSRTPTKKLEKSNGHGRLIQNGIGAVAIVGKPGNVILQSNETYTPEELKAQMLELCRAADLENGLIIDLMDFSGNRNPDEGMFMQRGINSDMPRVLKAYLVSAKDGSLTPLRGLEFENINERALKDILAVGNDFKENTLMFDRAFNNLASIVVPSILFEELELKKASVQSRKPPLVLNPLERGITQER